MEKYAFPTWEQFLPAAKHAVELKEIANGEDLQAVHTVMSFAASMGAAPPSEEEVKGESHLKALIESCEKHTVMPNIDFQKMFKESGEMIAKYMHHQQETVKKASKEEKKEKEPVHPHAHKK